MTSGAEKSAGSALSNICSGAGPPVEDAITLLLSGAGAFAGLWVGYKMST